jgi:hypothetical protein
MTPMQQAWKLAYARQRVHAQHGDYVVADDARITAALRRIFVRTRIVQDRMRSGRPASYPQTALFHPATRQQLSRWKF